MSKVRARDVRHYARDVRHYALGTTLYAHERDTTKGGRAEAIPIATELVPFLKVAMDASPSGLVFPKLDGSMMRRDVNLEWTLRRALGRAGVVEGYLHACRRKGCGQVVEAADQELRRCSKHRMKLWVKPKVRPIRFHDLRHSTASLLMMNGANPAAVQRILRHSDPRITTEVYGHLSPEYLRDEVDRLKFGPEVAALVPHLAVACPAGSLRSAAGRLAAPVLRRSAPGKTKAGTHAANTAEFRPSRMERETGFEPATLSLGMGFTESPGSPSVLQDVATAADLSGGVRPDLPALGRRSLRICYALATGR